MAQKYKAVVNVDRHIALETMFVVRGGIVHYDEYSGVIGGYTEYIRISNQINLEKLSVNMSTCFPSDFELALVINECYNLTFETAQKELAANGVQNGE